MTVPARLKFLRFCLVGMLGLLVDITVLYAAANLLGWYGARLLSFICAASVTWLLNRTYTFHRTDQPETSTVCRGQYLKYLLSVMLGGAVSYLVYVITINYLPFVRAPLAGVALGSVLGLALNFYLASSFVFNKSSVVNRWVP